MTAGWLISIPALPLAAAGIIMVAGHRMSRAAGWLTVAATAVSFVVLIALKRGLPLTAVTELAVIGDYHLTLGFKLDRLSFYTAVFVAAVAGLVNLYARGYMSSEAGRARFFAQMAFFTGAMLTLVLAGSFLVLFAAWEWVGLASFLLIGFHYREQGVPAAAKKAFLITRIGDMGLLLGWLWVLLLMGTTDIAALLEKSHLARFDSRTLTAIALLFLLGAVGKSAQLPLSVWLPPAMIGPTPVSALIHSATMVAAGVYLLLRLYPLFAAAPMALEVVFWVGGATALFAALAATTQADFKRVLAWSTISQLGEMFFAVGLAGPLAAFFHLLTHGAFKATLFLTAGAVQHGTGHRDLESLGGLWRKMPVTAAVFGIAALALAAVPPFSGFFSEDHILSAAVGRGFPAGGFLLLLVFLAGVYISRVGTAVFGRWPAAPEPAGEDPDRFMQAAMIVLAVFAAGLGWALSHTIGHMVPFEKHGAELTAGWKIAAVLAAATGIGWGTTRVIRHGPVPALGTFWSGLESGLNQATGFIGRIVAGSTRRLTTVERRADGTAPTLKPNAFSAAAACDNIEGLIEAGAQWVR
ncbi:MAG: NADH-quinone oxidoreductase subunit L, partial [Desulfobacterales bacterium]